MIIGMNLGSLRLLRYDSFVANENRKLLDIQRTVDYVVVIGKSVMYIHGMT